MRQNIRYSNNFSLKSSTNSFIIMKNTFNQRKKTLVTSRDAELGEWSLSIPNMWVPEGIEPIIVENSLWGTDILQ